MRQDRRAVSTESSRDIIRREEKGNEYSLYSFIVDRRSNVNLADAFDFREIACPDNVAGGNRFRRDVCLGLDRAGAHRGSKHNGAEENVEGGLLVAAQAGRGTDGLGVATVAMWPPVPRREADEGGRGAATRGRP